MRRSLRTALLIGATMWCLVIIIAPATGMPWFYAFFSIICHQEPERSWHLFGKSLPVCIRCASIYFAFAAALWLGLKANVLWLRIAVCFMFCEVVVARLFIDTEILRSISGVLVGLTAAPFVKQGIEEICDCL